MLIKSIPVRCDLASIGADRRVAAFDFAGICDIVLYANREKVICSYTEVIDGGNQPCILFYSL